MLVTAILVSFIVVCVAYWAADRWNTLNQLRRNGIPGPKPSFIMGNFNNKDKLGQLTLGKLRKQYGDIFSFYHADFPRVISFNKELNHLIQIKDFKYFTNRQGPFGDVSSHFKKNLLFLEDDDWRRVRALLRKCFTTTKLKTVTPVLNHLVKDLIKEINSKEGKEVDMLPLFQKVALGVFVGWGFGVQIDGDDPVSQALVVSAKRALVDPPGIIDNFFLIFRSYPKLLHYLGKVTKYLHKRRTEELIEVCQQIIEQRQNSGERRNDLLDFLMHAKISAKELSGLQDMSLTTDPKGEQLEDEDTSSGSTVNVLTGTELVAATTLLLGAAFHTVSLCMSYTLHLLAVHPEIQEKVRQEIRDQVESGEMLNYNIVNSLQYLDAVMDESLRIYPPATLFVVRRASVDYKFQNITIPKDTAVVIPTYYLHHDPENWDRPDEFDPERFLGANKDQINASIYQPFGDGPRNCLGLRLAVYEAKYVLSRLLLEYRFVPGENTRTNLKLQDHLVVISPENGVPMRAIKLEK